MKNSYLGSSSQEIKQRVMEENVAGEIWMNDPVGEGAAKCSKRLTPRLANADEPAGKGLICLAGASREQARDRRSQRSGLPQLMANFFSCVLLLLQLRPQA